MQDEHLLGRNQESNRFYPERSKEAKNLTCSEQNHPDTYLRQKEHPCKQVQANYKFESILTKDDLGIKDTD